MKTETPLTAVFPAQGEWEESGETIYAPSHHLEDNGHILIVHCLNVRQKENSQAICTAINNTYGKGINPEAVEDLRDNIIGCISELESIDGVVYDRETGGEIRIDLRIAELKEAIKKAEL